MNDGHPPGGVAGEVSANGFPGRVPIIGIGASAGGLEALRDMLSPARLPTGMAYVIVQHLDPTHESMLAELLDRNTALHVLQCDGGERLQADTVYIIPPGQGLAIRNGVLELTPFQQPRGLRRPIDDFLVSLASDQQANAACVILSGTGADGTTGLRAVKENGGICVVQQPESAKYDGMPTSAVGTGLVDFVRPPAEILECLQTFFQRRRADPEQAAADILADHIDDMCRVLRSTIGHDFSGYKRSTLGRRVERRMHVLGIGTGSAYLNRIRTDRAECDALFRDLLINVTRFFRDSDVFEVLREQVIQPLLRNRPQGEDIRVWVPGCSSGEEAYSIAMLFAEVAQEMGQPPAVQIFATDIDEQMLDIAREGSYPVSAMADIPPHLREAYTIPHAERFTISAGIRDLIRFSNHSLIKDPPFSRIDLVSCRNLLIYFDDRLQQSVIPLLHYAIRPDGYLMLGPSESVGRFDHLFTPMDGHSRLFERAPGAPTYPIGLPGRFEPRSSRDNGEDRGARTSLTYESVAVRRVMERYSPPSLVLDQDGSIVSAYGKLSRYFEFPVTRTGGTSAINLARPGLRNVLGPLMRQARDHRRRVVARDVNVETDFGTQQVEVVCDPLSDGTLLFIFRETAPFRPVENDELRDLEPGDDHIEALEDELRQTRHRLRTTVEELETANEELKSSNEEMMSMNEELQSTNEELSTVNDELKSKVDQLTVANSDLRNFHQSTEMAVVVLDADLRVRSYTESATDIFPLKPADRGRPLTDVASKLESSEYLNDARNVAAGAPAVQRRMTMRDSDQVYSMRVLPYRAQSGAVDGATMVLTDITDALEMERQLASERERLNLAIRAAGIGIWEYSPDNGRVMLDAIERRLMHARDDEMQDVTEILKLVHPDDRPEVEVALARTATTGADFEATFRLADKHGDQQWIKSFGRTFEDQGPRRLVGVSIDVTPEYAVVETREMMLREMNHRVKNLFAVISGIVSAAARSHTDVATLSADVRDRIASLGRAHSLASPAGEPEAIALKQLIEATLRPYRNNFGIEIEGPDVLVDRACLSPLALILHEWATNAVKYGAFTRGGDGKLRVRWHIESESLKMVWQEQGGPVSPPENRGFGTLLVETSIRQMRGSMRRDWLDNGFSAELTLPKSVMANG